MTYRKGEGKRAPTTQEWNEKFHHKLARAKVKALETCTRILRIGTYYAGRDKRKHNWDPLPKNAKEAQKYADLQAQAVDQILKFAGGKTGMKDAMPKEPSMDELREMDPEERYRTLHKFKLIGLRSDHWVDKILKAVALANGEVTEEEAGEEGRPSVTSEPDTHPTGEEDRGSEGVGL
jgi:hypothetical protein